MKRYFAIIAAILVTVLAVSCSKNKETPVTPKVFSMNTSLTLTFRNGMFKGTFANADKLSSLTLMLKTSAQEEFESHAISFNKSGFSKEINDLAFDTYTYYYEYVLDGVTKTTAQQSFSVLVGRWSTADGGHFEVYNTDGTGHMWDPADDVTEDEADNFDWSVDENNKMTQVIHFQGGQGDVPQYCNMLILSATEFKYNNEGWRAEYTLVRVNEETE